MENLKVLNTKFEKIALFGLLILLYFVFFQHLDSFHVRNWDESMFGVNAYEMYKNGNFITPFYKNTPDLWNSKPPFLLWIQVFFTKILGFNELAIRLPSAIASSVSALMLFFFVQKRSNIVLASCVFLVFITSFGVATFHSGRTGDSDALLSLFILLSFFSFYKFLFENHQTSILHFFIFLSLAFLTKSIAALLFIPALLFVVVYLKKVKHILSEKYFYIGFGIFVMSSVSYIYLREMTNPGYINYLVNVDLGRINKAVESHNEPFDFYFNNLFFYRFKYILLVIPGIFLLFINDKTKAVAVYVISLIVTYLFVISFSVTKLEWYDLPLFPMLSFASGYFIYFIIKTIKAKYDSEKLVIVLIIIFFCIPAYYAIRNSSKNEIPIGEKKLEVLTEYAFKNKNNSSLNNTTFLTSVFDRPLFFYKYYLNEKNQDFNIASSVSDIPVNSVVILADDSLKSCLEQKFKLESLDVFKTVTKFKILSKL